MKSCYSKLQFPYIAYTKDVIDYYKCKHLYIKYFKEPKIGLSKSRNTGILNSIYNWVVFIDDDCKTEQVFFKELENTILNYDFDAFTGVYFPWYMDTKPEWISNEFGKKDVVAKEPQLMQYPDHFSGGILAINKDVFDNVGLFNPHFGMVGNHLGYGEETDLQKRIAGEGYKIGINPNWKVLHLVRKDKYKVWWHLKRQFASGRDHAKFSKKMPFLKILFQPPFIFIKLLIPKSKLLISNQSYFWQNYLLDLFNLFFRNAGILLTKLKMLFGLKETL